MGLNWVKENKINHEKWLELLYSKDSANLEICQHIDEPTSSEDFHHKIKKAFIDLHKSFTGIKSDVINKLQKLLLANHQPQ